MKTEIACFVSPHGFGHATRTIALLEALQETGLDLHIHLVTTVPETLFKPTDLDYSYHPVIVDVGLIQKDSFTLDIPGSVKALEDLLPVKTPTLERLKKICSTSELIIADISPLGICVAKACSIPSVLVENFTWDWIYAHLGQAAAFEHFIPVLQELYGQADFHIQAEPICSKRPCDLRCPPIARKLQSTPDAVRRTLNSGKKAVVLITMGGIPTSLPFIRKLSGYQDYYFILAGQRQTTQLGNNVCALGYDTTMPHPDLMNSSDLVICKSGYSTIAECCQTSASIVCIQRADFPESKTLERFVRENLAGVIYNQQQFSTGQWLKDLPELTKRRAEPYPADGAKQAAGFITSLLDNKNH